MAKTLLQILGYALLALVVGATIWFVRGQHEHALIGDLSAGVCVVAGVVGGLWLRRRWFQRGARLQ